jgi:hypothetical protein
VVAQSTENKANGIFKTTSKEVECIETLSMELYSSEFSLQNLSVSVVLYWSFRDAELLLIFLPHNSIIKVIIHLNQRKAVHRDDKLLTKGQEVEKWLLDWTIG